MTPLQETLTLQKKVRHTASYDPDLSMTRLMKRFRVGKRFLLELLGDVPAVPPAYRRASGRIQRDIAEVVERKEAGDEFCTKCHAWYPRRQFALANNSSMRHNAGMCVGKKNEQ